MPPDRPCPVLPAAASQTAPGARPASCACATQGWASPRACTPSAASACCRCGAAGSRGRAALRGAAWRRRSGARGGRAAPARRSWPGPPSPLLSMLLTTPAAAPLPLRCRSLPNPSTAPLPLHPPGRGTAVGVCARPGGAVLRRLAAQRGGGPSGAGRTGRLVPQVRGGLQMPAGCSLRAARGCFQLHASRCPPARLSGGGASAARQPGPRRARRALTSHAPAHARPPGAAGTGPPACRPRCRSRARPWCRTASSGTSPSRVSLRRLGLASHAGCTALGWVASRTCRRLRASAGRAPPSPAVLRLRPPTRLPALCAAAGLSYVDAALNASAYSSDSTPVSAKQVGRGLRRAGASAPRAVLLRALQAARLRFTAVHRRPAPAASLCAPHSSDRCCLAWWTRRVSSCRSTAPCATWRATRRCLGLLGASRGALRGRRGQGALPSVAWCRGGPPSRLATPAGRPQLARALRSRPAPVPPARLPRS